MSISRAVLYETHRSRWLSISARAPWCREAEAVSLRGKLQNFAFGRDAILAASGVICLAGPVLAMCVRITRHLSTRKVSGSRGVS